MASRVALVQCGDHRDNQRRVLPLAQALRDRGWYPVVMPYDRRQGTLFLSHGIDVCPLDRPLGPPARLRQAADALLAGRRRRYRGIDLAALDAIERARAPARFATPARRYRRWLDVVRRTDALAALLDRTRPAHAYVWNGMTGTVAHCLRQLCQQRGIELSYLERGLLPDSTFLDRLGVNGASDLHRRTLDELPPCDAAVPELPAAQPDPRRAASARARLGAERIIFVPLQVQRDTNLIVHSDRIKTMRALLERVADAAPDGVVVVARRHPEERQTDLALPSRPNLRYVDDGSVEDWCDDADLVVTVNSTVGLTALLRGTAVVALGRALYTNKGLCLEPAPGDLPRLLGDPASYQPPDRDRVRRFHRVLIGRHTAAPGRAPELIEPIDGSAPSHTVAGAPFNPHGHDPARFAGAWSAAITRARAALAGHASVAVWSQLEGDETLRLSYRELHQPVSLARLLDGLAGLLELDRARLELTTSPPRAGVANLVIRSQARRPATNPDTVLVVDPYTDPHAAWLLGR